MKKILLCFGFLAGVAAAQSPVINYAVTTARLDTNFAPGSILYIYGTFAEHAAGRDFTISVGGQSGGINVADTTQFITAEIPLSAPTGAQTLVVTYQGNPSNALPIAIAAVAPEFQGGGVTISGPTTPPVYGAYYPFSHYSSGKFVTPQSPATPGEIITSSASGLGAQTSPTTLTVAGLSAQLLASVTAGSSSIFFNVPSATPVGVASVILTVGGVASNTASLPVGAAPAIGSLLNGASFSSAGTAAPGSIVSLFGQNLGSTDQLGTFPSTTVQGDTVLFGSTPAPIFALAASGGQINVVVPDELPTSGTVSVTVQTPAGTSAPYIVNLAPAVPGIFYYGDPLDPTRRNAVAVQANTAWIAMPLSMAPSYGLPTNCSALGAATLCGEPIKAGGILEIFVTGLGTATPNGVPGGAVLPTGQAAPASGNPLYVTVATPTVTVGGLSCLVLFSGLAPGYAGLYQLDVQLPAGVPSGNDVPLQVSMPGSSTDTATVAIQ